MSFKRKSAAEQIQDISDDDDYDLIIHEHHNPVAAIAPTADPEPVIEVHDTPKPALEQSTELQGNPIGQVDVPHSGLSNAKSKVMNVRCQANWDTIIVDAAATNGLTVSSFLQLAAMGLAQQPEEVVNKAWKLTRGLETSEQPEGDSPVRRFRHSPRFMAEILEPLSTHHIFANNKSMAIKTAATWLAFMDVRLVEETIFALRISDSKSKYGLTENARAKST
jgi:prophage maintenance system killer protein